MRGSLSGVFMQTDVPAACSAFLNSTGHASDIRFCLERRLSDLPPLHLAILCFVNLGLHMPEAATDIMQMADGYGILVDENTDLTELIAVVVVVVVVVAAAAAAAAGVVVVVVVVVVLVLVE